MILGDLQARQAWRGALVSAALNAVAMPMDTRARAGHPEHARLAVPLLERGGGRAGRRAAGPATDADRPTRVGRLSCINNLVIVLALWVTSSTWATTTRWVPFQANKLGVLAVAVLAPDTTVGLACIAGYIGMVLLKVQMFAPAIRAQFPVGEPWTRGERA